MFIKLDLIILSLMVHFMSNYNMINIKNKIIENPINILILY